MNREQQLQGLIGDVLRAISQLKPEARTVDTSVQNVPKKTQKLPSVDAAVTIQSSGSMEELSNKLSSLAKESESTALEQMLLNSLWFKSMTERHTNVAPAHEETFKWMFGSSSPTRFEHWLRFQSGIYWVMGKAGSGKSTLMKFLLGHQQTKDSLILWAGTKKLVIAKFFFWNAGNDMQKSQIGLFRSLLYEVLRQCPDLIQIVCASKLETLRPFTREPEPWTQPELCQAISQLQKQSGIGSRFCFFIDGLDEYDGDPKNIVDVLESFRSWPEIKLCISSRPWNEFIDAFGRHSDPQLALEDLTRKDIKLYVRDTLEENSRFKALKARDDRTQDLVQEIVEKARGVFLWVFLVVRSLLTGLTNADRISDLQKRLHSFPPTLEGFFHHMFASIEDIYHEQTAQTFTLALAAVEPLSLMTYSFLDAEDIDLAMPRPSKALTVQDAWSRKDDMQRRLNARCKGLLEVGEGGDGSFVKMFLEPRVDFLHRTARDFLITKDMQNMLARNLKHNFEPKSCFCKAFVAQMKALDYRGHVGSEPVFEDLLENLTFYAHELELEAGVHQAAFLDEVEKLYLVQGTHEDRQSSESKFLRFLLQRGLFLYVAERVIKYPQVVHAGGEPLLYSALHPQNTKYRKGEFDLKMIDMLLEHGASPNQIYKGLTVWGHFILSVRSSTHEDMTLLPIIESLLLHGAYPHQLVITEYKTSSRRDTGRAADLYKETLEIPVYKSTMTIISEQFGEEQARKVLSKAPKTILSRLVSWVFSW